MNAAVRSLLCAGVLACVCAAPAQTPSVSGPTFVDDAGRQVALEPPAVRVVTLAPSLSDFVVAAGGAAQLVGYVGPRPPALAAKARAVGDHQRLDVERILTLRPDLVLAWAQQGVARELAQLEALGLRVVYIEPRRLGDVPDALARVAALLGHANEGQRLAQALRGEMAQLRLRYADRDPVRVFFQVWPRPLLSVNDRHLIADVIRLCGGRNVMATSAALVPAVSREAVVQAQPEVIFAAPERGAAGSQGDPEGDARRAPDDPVFAQWAALGSIPAVRGRWLFTLPGDEISRQGPRIVGAARALCEAVDQVRTQRASRP